MKFSALLTYLFFCLSYSSTAQVCNGSLGDPVVNETFGARGGTSLQHTKPHTRRLAVVLIKMAVISVEPILSAIFFLAVAPIHGYRW